MRLKFNYIHKIRLLTTRSSSLVDAKVSYYCDLYPISSKAQIGSSAMRLYTKRTIFAIHLLIIDLTDADQNMLKIAIGARLRTPPSLGFLSILSLWR